MLTFETELFGGLFKGALFSTNMQKGEAAQETNIQSIHAEHSLPMSGARFELGR